MGSKIALFHPWIKSKGGAEKVVLKLAKSFDADIYTWIYDEENTFEDFKKFDITVVAPRFMKRFSRGHLSRGLFLPFSFLSKIPLEKYDKLLISTSGVGEFVAFRNYKKGQTYSYVHTPLREADDKIVEWNLKNRYSKLPGKKFLYLLSVGIYKIFEKLAWRRIDYAIFNSELSRERAERKNLLKNKDSCVIHPPVDIMKKTSGKTGDYLLYVSRINPPKRQLELIKAFKNLAKDFPLLKLVIVGNIDNKKYYEKITNFIGDSSNIELRQNVSDKELSKLYSNCLAGIFLGYQEDFGIVPLEILQYGKPLIAPNEGGYVDLIKGNPMFYDVKERHDSEDVKVEIEKTLRKFLGNKKKLSSKKIKIKDFVGEMKKVLS